ncbi:MAG: aminotransferase class V-fold PLP-dependent enzyme [Acidobacteriota bacterium]
MRPRAVFCAAHIGNNARGAMTFDRRSFLNLALPAAAFPRIGPHSVGSPALEERLAEPGEPEAVARDEEFWSEVRSAFVVDRGLINLNNGGVSPALEEAHRALLKYLETSNLAPNYYMWRILEPGKEQVRRGLARLFGCDPEEIAVTRNASEALVTCQYGFDLAPGDEVLTTNQDYPRMLNAWKQLARRRGVVLRTISLPVPAEDEDEIVRRFEAAVTTRTRVILICHMINLTGQILPVAKIVGMARRRGIPVIVDGAHSFAHLDFHREDLDCDYFGASLHKWLFSPVGSGLLYVRRDRIRDLWSLMPCSEGREDDIRKFEEIGTHPAANFLAALPAIVFHERLGAARKEARLRYLKDYWARPLAEEPRVILHTSLDPRFSCGIATFQVEGLNSGDLGAFLWRKYRILTTTVRHAEFEGIRVTPSLYTTPAELDRFCDAVRDAIANGIR